MRVRSISIHLVEFGADAGNYTGELKVENNFGTIALRLNAAASNKILAVVAEELVASAKSVGQLLTADVVENLPALLREQAS